MAVRQKLAAAYYQTEDVTGLAKDLLGKFLMTKIDGQLTGGMIVETEAYRGPDDRACHAFKHRRTPRTEVMFNRGGVAYIYLCYGIHHLMNVVTGPKDHAHAILIRALEPADGKEVMAGRRGLEINDVRLTKGPGALSQALGLNSVMTGTSLHTSKTPVWIEDRGVHIDPNQLCFGPRIGVDWAGEAATWPWRFFLKENKNVSAHRRCV